jgi:dTDP-4-dehydrorhamnose reductase
MRIAVTGSKGQLGEALQKMLQREQLLLMDLPEHDITDLDGICGAVRSFGPDVVIHTAAATDVDGCERQPKVAYCVNAVGTRNMAVAAQQSGAPLVYISTDYVFDGRKDEPYWEYDRPNPLSVYARSKWAGEQIVRDLLQRFYVVRVAWLYGDGPRNFVRTVLRLAQERGELQMVTDEVGSPTWAEDVAEALSRLIQYPAYGFYHLPNAGTCSRYEWTLEILRLAGLAHVPVTPIRDYARDARVPKRVALHNCTAAQLGIRMRPWRRALEAFMRQEGIAEAPRGGS